MTHDAATLDGAFLAGVSAADVAQAMRRRMFENPPPPPPRADRMMGGLFAAAILGAALVTGFVAVTLRPQTAPVEHSALVRIGEDWLTPPLAMMGPSPEDVRHEVGMLRLRLAWPSLEPARGAANLHVTIAAADPQFDPGQQVKTWSRFLAPTAWSNPGGLVARQFRKGNAFEGSELYLAMPDGKAFAALCPLAHAPATPATPAIEEPCRTTFRHGKFDVALRFPREALADWQGLTAGIKSLIDALKR